MFANVDVVPAMRCRARRAIVAGVAILGIGFVLSVFMHPIGAAAASPCGGDGERGCCVLSTERLSTGGCESGAVELPGCGSDQGDCKCGGSGLAVLLDFSSSGHCVKPTACGGLDQRACCTIEPRYPQNPIPLSAGCSGTADGGIANLTEVAVDISSDPDFYVCGGDNPLGTKSNGLCKPCGSDGAKQCFSQSNEGIGCNSGLTPDFFGFCTTCGGENQPPCDGLQFGTPTVFLCNPGLHPDGGVCVKDGTIEEPGCNCAVASSPAGDPALPVNGYADLHLHMFANLGFGGLTVWGDAFDKRGGISQALRADNYAQRTADYIVNGHVKQGINGDRVPVDLFRKQQLVHGDNHFNDFIGAGTNQHIGLGPGFFSLSNSGVQWDDTYTDHFVGWPRWNSTTHQQSYYTWLQRAHRGGLRLAVVLAVTNETMCIAGRYLDYPEFECAHGMRSVDLQLAKAFELEAWLNDQCKDGLVLRTQAQESNNPIFAAEKLAEANVLIDRSCASSSSAAGSSTSEGWFKVVTTPQQARNAIAKGKLAVVLGIEEANLFGCNDGTCTADYIQEQLDKYFDLGVRHIFPIHNFDNDYGGAASWMDTIAVGNRYATGSWYATEECPPTEGSAGLVDGYGFKLAPGLSDWLASLILGVSLDTPDYYPTRTTSCNQKGLTPLGTALVNSMMSKGMIIDIDHMSIKATDATLDLAEQNSYPGIVASHALMFDLTQQPYRHERMRTKQDLQRIAALGGMIGVMTQPPEGGGVGRDQENTLVNLTGSSKVNNDCPASSKTWAQAYEWAVQNMTVGDQKRPVAFGTDFNGISRHNAPRFGDQRCDNQRDTMVQNEATRVTYPFEIPGFGTFNKQETGGREFDYNESGLAHVGLLPDMIADLKMVGLNDEDLQPLFKSAEGYIRMWEKSLEAAATIAAPPSGDTTAPTVTASLSPLPNAAAWHNDPSVVLTLEAADNPGGSGVTNIIYRFTSGDFNTVEGSRIDLRFEEGRSVVLFTARDLAGNANPLQSAGVRLDLTAPTVTASAAPAPNGNGWNNTDVTVTYSGTDALSGIGACDSPSILNAGGAGQSASGSCADRAGNTASATASGINIDKSPPAITVNSPAHLAEFVLAQSVLAGWSAADTLSGVDSATGTVPSGTPIDTSSTGTHSFTVHAVDKAGNPAAVSHTYTVLSAADATQRLIGLIRNLGLKAGTAKALVAKLKDLSSDSNPKESRENLRKLRAFIKFVEAQSGKSIPVSQADVLIGEAQKIVNALPVQVKPPREPRDRSERDRPA
jgi:microsomal dipeptidase-like Zn-dependent dipeptidase